MISKSAHIVGLTSLRGIAAMGIVVHHFVVMLFPDLHSFFIPSRAISKLYLFVDLFFILSGFVLSHVYCEQFKTGLTVDGYKRFMLARFARIYPVHFFMLLVFLVFHLIYLIVLANASNPEFIQQFNFSNGRTASLFISNVFLLQAVSETGSWNGPAWSISAEWFAYLLIPFLVAFVQRMNRVQQIIIFTLGLVVLIVIEAIKGDLGLWWEGWPLIVRCMAEASMGIMLYQRYRMGLAQGFSGRSVTIIFLACGVSMALPIPHVITVLLFALLILATTQIQESSSHWLVHQGLIHLGVISYSTYMVHALVRQLIMEPSIWFLDNEPGELLSLAEEVGVLIVAIALTIGLSSLCYKFIETPWRIRIVRSMCIRRLIGLRELKQ